MKKKEYIQPEFEIVLLEQENVITESHWDGPPTGGGDDTGLDTGLDSGLDSGLDNAVKMPFQNTVDDNDYANSSW